MSYALTFPRKNNYLPARNPVRLGWFAAHGHLAVSAFICAPSLKRFGTGSLVKPTMMITVTDDDAAFVWVKEWFLRAKKFLKRIRRVDLDTTMRNERIALIPAPGLHWFWYGGRPFQVWFSRTEETNGNGLPGGSDHSVFVLLAESVRFLQRLTDDVVQCHLKRLGVRSYLYTYNDGWDYVGRLRSQAVGFSRAGTRRKRNICSKDISRFLKNRSCAIPVCRASRTTAGIICCMSPPGTGKTSLVSALAAHFGALNFITLNTSRTLMTGV